MAVKPSALVALVVVVGALVATTALLAATLSMCGVYADREFGEHSLFVKHRPSTTLMFRSPVGEGDACHLSPEALTQENEYVEFVEDRGGFRRALSLPF